MNIRERFLGRRGLCIAGLCAVMLCVPVGAAWAQEVTEGSLQVFDKDMRPVGLCPLKHTDVQVEISGFVARVTLTQEFENPFEEPIEAVYTFPMSDRAAVDSMTMRIGERVIKGLIKEREEARRIYEQAKQAGQTASLLDQERPNIFTQSVANILPGDAIHITISYVEVLQYEDSAYEFSFPMVVGPRYIPKQPSVPDAGRVTPPVTPEGTRAGHDISLRVALDAGVPIKEVRSMLHDVNIEGPTGSKAVVELATQQEIPNRDFVLKYAVAGERIEDAVLLHHDARGGFFTLILQPPARVEPEQITPKEMIFVIDCSGSMRGFPIEKAKHCMKLCIEQMNSSDSFNLVTFAGGVGYCFDKPVPNTPANRQKALEYLANLEGGGGTEMMKAIHAALEGQDDPDRLRIVCFMTDGFIGNDMQILDAIQKNAGTARVFAFGIGNGVNRFLIEGMGREGRGASEIVTLESDGEEAAQRFHERIHSPLLTDIAIDFGGLPIEDVYPDPKAIPDLFAARPLVLKGRYTGAGAGTITLRGMTAQGPYEKKIEARFETNAPDHDALAPLWAREKVEHLMAQDWMGVQQGAPGEEVKSAITKLGLEFSLMTQYTSFVAVEERVVNDGGVMKTVQVPVEMTDGVSYEGVFGESADQFTAGGRFLKMGAGVAQSASTAAPLSLMRAGDGVRGGVLAESAPPVESRVRRERGELPAAEPEPVKPRDEKDGDAAWRAKIDPALLELAAKLVNGAYESGAVKVVNGRVRVYIELSGDSDANVEALKTAGARIVSHAASSKKVLAELRVEDIEKVAKLEFVKRITPPAF